MTSVQQLFHSLENSFIPSNDPKRHKKVSSSCYETVLNTKYNPSFSKHLTSKASDYSFVATKYGFTDRAQRLYDCVDTIMDDKDTKQHHFDVFAIMLQLSESLESGFNPIQNSKKDAQNLMESRDISSLDHDILASNTSNSHNQTIHNMHHLFSAIPCALKQEKTLIRSNALHEIESDSKEIILNEEITDNDDDNLWISDTNDFSLNPFSSKISYSVDNNHTNTTSIAINEDEDDNNFMGVGLYDDLSCFNTDLFSTTQSSINHSIYDIDTICSFRDEWRDLKSKWKQLEDDTASKIIEIDTKDTIIPTDDRISCSYFNGSHISEIHERNQDYLLSDQQLDIYHKRYILGCNVSPKAQFVAQSEVLSSILNALLGAADNEHVICYDHKCNEFFPIQCFCRGITVETMSDILQNVCDIATKYKRIEQFTNLEHHNNSFITQCLCFAVNEYLHFYKECVLSLPSSIEKQYSSLLDENETKYELNIMDVMCHLSKWSESINFLYDLCCSLRRISAVDILQFLYDKISKSIDNEHCLTKYLFQHCCEPLMDIISSYIYCGEIKDFYHEISTKVEDDNSCNTKYIQFDKLPLFLEALRCDIERTGYALNILRKCDYTLFCSCFVPNFFDESESINYPLCAAFNYDEIKLFTKRQKTLIKLQLSFFEDLKRKFYEKEKREKELIRAQNIKQIEVWRKKIENDEKEIEIERKEIKKKQNEMRLALQRNIYQRKDKKKKKKQQRIEMERKQLTQQEIEEEKEINVKKSEIEAEIKRVKEETKHNSLLMEWKIKRAQLNPKRSQLIHDLDAKYFKEFQELKQQKDVEDVEDVENVENVEKVEKEAQIATTKKHCNEITTLTQQTLQQFESLQIEVVEDKEEEGSLAIPLEEEDDDLKLEIFPSENEVKRDITFEDESESDEKEAKSRIKYKAKAFDRDFRFSAAANNHEEDSLQSHTYHVFLCNKSQESAFIPIRECIKQSIFGGIQLQSFMVDKVTLFLFMNKLKLLSHFESLNRFYLMNCGDLMNRLCHNLFVKRDCVAFNDGAFINLIFCELIKNMKYENDPFVARLKFIPSCLKKKELEGYPLFLRNILLQYRVKWPLTEIITPKLQQSLNLIFIFFLYLHHVKWQLIECWKMMKVIVCDDENDSVLNKYGISWHILRLFRRESQLIIDNLMSFFNNQILNISWSRFKNKIEQIEKNNGNIFEIKDAHQKYVQHLLDNCFLNEHQNDLRKRIHKMLQLMCEFKNNTQTLLELVQLKNSNMDLNYINDKNIDGSIRNIVHCMRSFESVCKFVFKMLDGLKKRRVSHVIHHLLIQLDFNSFYKEEQK